MIRIKAKQNPLTTDIPTSATNRIASVRNRLTQPSINRDSSYHRIIEESFEQDIEVDEDLSLTVSGRRMTSGRLLLYYGLCVVTLGIFYLLSRWNIQLETSVKTHRCPLREATHVLIKNHWGEISLEEVVSEPFEGASLSEAFPQLFGAMSPYAASHMEPLVDRPLESLVYFEYRYFKFLLEPLSGHFMANYLWRDPKWSSVDYVIANRDTDASIRRKHAIFGFNAIEMKEKSSLRLLIDEVLHPFFVFQIASIILWSLDSYYYYATCIFVISTSSAIATLLETKKSLRRMRDLSRFSCQIRYWRNGSWAYGRSEELVPGDLFELESGLIPIVPCDAILLTGDCIVNESMLTGESLPVSKTAAIDSDLASINFEEEEPASSSRMSRFFLFSGTEIIRVRSGHKPTLRDSSSDIGGDPMSLRRGAIALVVRTGFNTTKGSLIRSMLFPRPTQFKFYQDSFKFIGVLAAIAGLGFIASMYNFIKMGMSFGTILVRALDLITIVVPPALPATLAIGTSFAISRLRKEEIFCTSPPRVNICGKINVMCFDKTGTLTQEGLDVLGIRFTVPRTRKADMPYEEVESHTPLRFSRMYRSVDSVMFKPVSIPTTPINATKFSPFSPKSSIMSPVKSLVASLPLTSASGVSISMVAAEPGHPNSESDFPYPLIVCAMATCHSIKVVHGSLVGDPLDLKMFDFTGWHIEEDILNASSSGLNANTMKRGASRSTSSMIVRPPWVPDFDTVVNGGRNGVKFNPDEIFTELGVVRSFEFLSSLRRMSVVVRRMKYSHNMFAGGLNESNSSSISLSSPTAKDLEVFVKGAPEVMRSICTPESLPVNYDDQLREYTHHGYRVIACAWRKLEGITLPSMQKMKRTAVECELQFLGFIVFENKLKSGTTQVLQTLHKASIRQVMCTGDSLLTSVSVSRECGLVDPSKKIYVPRFVEGQAHEESATIVWEDVDESGDVLDNTTFKPVNVVPVNETRRSVSSSRRDIPSLRISIGNSNAPPSGVTQRLFRTLSSTSNDMQPPSLGNYELAITGDVFQWMLDFASDEVFERMLIKCQIFSRMSPDQKHFLVENLQHLGYCVGFCGDGTNDCGALKAADTGLSLSEAEASVAAPFTSKSKDVDCVLRVIREGRAALVTSFSCFKYMALYSLIQFTTVSLLYTLGQNIDDFQFMYIDLVLIIPIAVFMGRTGPHTTIFSKRPTASLVSKKVLTSMIGQVIIQIFFQVVGFVWVQKQPWYVPGKGDMDNQVYESFENSLVFLVSCFQYILIAIVFTVGPPYQESIWNNSK